MVGRVGLLVALSGVGCQAILGIGATKEVPPDAAIHDARVADAAERDAPVTMDATQPSDAAVTNFTVSLTPSYIHVVRNGPAASASVTLGRASGFTGAVVVSAVGLPADVTASSVSIANGESAKPISFTAGTDAPLGLFVAMLAGKSGNETESSQFQILVADAPGTFDQTFNGGAVQAQPLGAVNYIGGKALVRSDGRIVYFVTSPQIDEHGASAVGQLETNGQPDLLFGTEGTTVLDDFVAADLALGPGGDVVLVGAAGGSLGTTLLRLDTNGNLDSDFGGAARPDAGTLTGEVGDSRGVNPSGVAVQSSGAIVYAQALASSSVAVGMVCRLTAVGLPDGNFGSAGCLESTTGEVTLAGIAVSGSDDIYVGGVVGTGTTRAFYSAHLDPNGHVGHEVSFPAPLIGQDYLAAGVTIDGSDALIVGYEQAADVHAGALARAGDSAADSSFNSTGILAAGLGNDNNTRFSGAVEQPDTNIVAVGSTGMASQIIGCALRVDSTGSTDTSFGSSGAALFTATDGIESVALAPEGRLVVLGFTGAGFVYIARIWQ